MNNSMLSIAILVSLVTIVLTDQACDCPGDKRGFVRIGKPDVDAMDSSNELAAIDPTDIRETRGFVRIGRRPISAADFVRIGRQMAGRKRQSSFVRIG